jgi:hypothetical protein
VTPITVADIARDRGWHRVTAYRWLKAIEDEHGDKVVSRRGRTLIADAEALAKVAQPPVEELLRQALNRIALLESAYRGQDLRINGISRDLVDLRRRARAKS